MRAHEHPGFVLHLVLEDKEIKFETELKFYEEIILNVYDLMLSSISMIPRVETQLYPEWVSGKLCVCASYFHQGFKVISFSFKHSMSSQPDSQYGNFLKPTILPEFLQAQQEEVRRVFWAECVRPKEYIHEYDKYAALVSRQAEEYIEQFLSEQHSSQEIVMEMIHYQQLADQIQYTSCKVLSQQGGMRSTKV